jgi:hypothetical protein
MEGVKFGIIFVVTIESLAAYFSERLKFESVFGFNLIKSIKQAGVEAWHVDCARKGRRGESSVGRRESIS